MQWDLLPIRSDLLQEDNDKTKQSPSSTGPRSEASSVLLPTFTPVSLAASETSAFTGVMATPLHAVDDVTTPTSSPSTYYSEDEWTDSPRQGKNHLQSRGYRSTNNETVSFARGHLRSKPPALTTVEVHNEIDNGEHSSSIMTPVKDEELPRRAVDPNEEEDTTMVDSWNEAELVVPDSPALHLLQSMESDPTASVLTTTVGPTTSSSYKETIPSLTPPNIVRPVAVKPPKGKAGGGKKKRRSHQSQVDFSDSSASDVIPPASVATAPALKSWKNLRRGQNVSNHLNTMPTILHSNDNLVSMATSTVNSEKLLSHCEESNGAIATSETSVLCLEQQRLLPVSSSPVDIVVMLSRMASFCASLTLVLAPKLPVNTGISAGK